MMPEDPRPLSCPNDEMLAAFVEGHGADDTRAAVESHVASCATCLDVVAALLPGADVAAPSSAATSVAAPITQPRAATRRWRRWAMAAVLVLAFGTVVAGAFRDTIGARMAPALARAGSRALGIPIDAEAVGVRMTGPSTFVLTIGQVSFGAETDMLVHADAISVTLGLAALVSDAPLVTSIRVDRPRVDLAGRDPIAILTSKNDRTQIAGLLGGAPRVDIADARIALPGPDGKPFVLTGVAGGMERTATGISLVLRGRAAGGSVDLVGTMSADGRDLVLTIGGRGLDAGAVPIVGGRLRGMLDLSLDLGADGRALRADGRVAVRNGRLIGRGLGALVALSPPSRAALVARDPALAGNDLSFDDARAVVKWRRDTWRFPRVFVQSRDVIVGGRGRMAATGAMTGHGTIRLPPVVVDALQPHEPMLGSFTDPNGTATLPFAVSGTWQEPRLALGPP